jgi:hypothetical protein
MAVGVRVERRPHRRRQLMIEHGREYHILSPERPALGRAPREGVGDDFHAQALGRQAAGADVGRGQDLVKAHASLR